MSEGKLFLSLTTYHSSLFQNVRADRVAREEPAAFAFEQGEFFHRLAALEARAVDEFERVTVERRGGALLLAARVERAALDPAQTLAHAPEEPRVLFGAHGRAPLLGRLAVDLRVAARGDVFGHAVDRRLRGGRNPPPLVHGASREEGQNKKAKGESKNQRTPLHFRFVPF